MTTFERSETRRDQLLLTISEAAGALRISKSKAYELARRYLATGGREGLPVIRIGPGILRVPSWALDVLIRTGRVVKLSDAAVEDGE